MATIMDIADWQVAPAEHEYKNYDEPKVRYRKYTQEYIMRFQTRVLRKKTFFTIATNVLCADKASSKVEIDPANRDLYLPLEISILKWNLKDAEVEPKLRIMESKVWMIDPGRVPLGCENISRDHKKKYHKILFEPGEPNVYVDKDIPTVMREINSFLSPDRVVFSLELKHVRQDLGCLKWLNAQTGYKSRPVKVLNMLDLYVCLVRRLNPDMGLHIGLGVAHHYIVECTSGYELQHQCDYHQDISKNEMGECCCCAKGLCLERTHKFLDEIGQVLSDMKQN